MQPLTGKLFRECLKFYMTYAYQSITYKLACVSIGIVLHGTYSVEVKGKQLSAGKTRVKPILAQQVHVLHFYHYCNFVANVHLYNG